jgi:16S rRNA (guanine527-N7)-methyltransferase
MLYRGATLKEMLNKIFEYFPDLSEIQKARLTSLNDLYISWNKEINVISRKDINNLYLHHVLHSLAIAKVVQFLPDAKVLDLGTGGGFPGIPLAILFPQTNILLVDSIGKKIKVATAIAKDLKLKNVQTLYGRAEDISGKFDFIVSRAVASLDKVWDWSEPIISHKSNHRIPNGLLYLKGSDFLNELPHSVDVKSWNISDMFMEDYFIGKAVVLLYSHKA